MTVPSMELHEATGGQPSCRAGAEERGRPRRDVSGSSLCRCHRLVMVAIAGKNAQALNHPRNIPSLLLNVINYSLCK